jgi:hypothetical protein
VFWVIETESASRAERVFSPPRASLIDAVVIFSYVFACVSSHFVVFGKSLCQYGENHTVDEVKSDENRPGSQ